MDRESFIDQYGMNDRAVKQLDRYYSSLLSFQNNLNLISSNSVEEIWQRHFFDSAQLLKFAFKRAKKGLWIDVGSGAGFPGIVISLLGYEKVYLVESNKKKATFLQYVIDDMGLKAKVIPDRVENLSILNPSIVSARAVCSLKRLLKLIYPMVGIDTLCVFPKGETYSTELNAALKFWDINYKLYFSETNSRSRIITIESYKKINKLSRVKN